MYVVLCFLILSAIIHELVNFDQSRITVTQVWRWGLTLERLVPELADLRSCQPYRHSLSPDTPTIIQAMYGIHLNYEFWTRPPVLRRYIDPLGPAANDAALASSRASLTFSSIHHAFREVQYRELRRITPTY